MSNSTLSALPTGHLSDPDSMSDQCIHQVYSNEGKKSIRGRRGKRRIRRGRERDKDQRGRRSDRKVRRGGRVRKGGGKRGNKEKDGGERGEDTEIKAVEG